MESLRNVRLWGFIGSILIAFTHMIYIGGIGLLFAILEVIGIILVLMAVRILSRALGKPLIFILFLMSFILMIFSIIPLAMLFSLGKSTPLWVVRGLVILLFTLYFLAYIFLGAGCIMISTTLNIKTFLVSGVLYIIAPLASISIGGGTPLGFVFPIIASILQAIAFHQIPENIPTQQVKP